MSPILPLNAAMPGVTKAMKKRVSVPVVFATQNGICETLEGPVPYSVGDAIMTGVQGEHWPITRAHFDQMYEAEGSCVFGQDGMYVKKPIPVLALQLVEPFSVDLSNGGRLNGNAGDWLLQYEPGKYGIVQAAIFDKTYESVR